MTSPYLERPRRRLDVALKQRGLTRAEVGMPDGGIPASGHARPRRSLRTFGRKEWYALGIGALALSGALAIALTLSQDQVAMDPDPNEVLNIAPAAGPVSEK